MAKTTNGIRRERERERQRGGGGEGRGEKEGKKSWVRTGAWKKKNLKDVIVCVECSVSIKSTLNDLQLGIQSLLLMKFSDQMHRLLKLGEVFLDELKAVTLDIRFNFLTGSRKKGEADIAL